MTKGCTFLQASTWSKLSKAYKGLMILPKDTGTPASVCQQRRVSRLIRETLLLHLDLVRVVSVIIDCPSLVNNVLQRLVRTATWVVNQNHLWSDLAVVWRAVYVN